MRIKFNSVTKRFSLDEDPVTPVVDDGTSEPIDYLNGTPATVLDLKNPIYEYTPGDVSKKLDEMSNGDDEVRNYLPEWEDNYRDVISNLNKESAISHRLNELGSTNYDLTGEDSRFEGTEGLGSIVNANAEPNSEDYGEAINLGAVSIPDKYRDPSNPHFDYHLDLGNVVSHELGHLNDPNLDETINYNTKLGDEYLRQAYGDKFMDAYNDFKSPDSDSFGTNMILRHDRTPFEVYADAASMRSALFKSGAWDGREPITEDMINDYLKSEDEFMNSTKNGNVDWYPDNSYINYGSSSQRLNQYFDVDKIAELLNSSRRFSDTELQELDQYANELPEGDLSTIDTKEFIGVKEPNRPFHRTSFKYGK